MKVFFPANLDLEALLAKHPPQFNFKYNLDDFKYIIGTIIRIKALFKDYHNEKFVPVNAQILQSKVREYNHYIAYLLQHKIIEVANEGQYIIGKKSRRYKLNDIYTQKEDIFVEVENRSLVSKRKKDAEKERIVNEDYYYLTKWFNENLQVDFKAAKRLLRVLYIKEHKGFEPDEKKSTLFQKYSYRLTSLRMLDNQMFQLSVDNKISRYHSNLTNLKKELRNYITYEGRTLCAVDVKNSQPFISTILFIPAFYQQTAGEFNLFNLSPTLYNLILPNIPSILSILSTIPSLIMLVNNYDKKPESDIEEYGLLVDRGTFYPYFSQKYFEKTGIKLNVDIPDEKQQLKEVLFTTFFSDNRFIGQEDAKMKRLFRDTFPNVYEIFRLIKKRKKNNLSLILQLVESEIIIRRAAKRIAENNPEMPIFTIHDSIVVPAEYREMAKLVLKQEFENALGLRPNLAFEMWERK